MSKMFYSAVPPCHHDAILPLYTHRIDGWRLRWIACFSLCMYLWKLINDRVTCGLFDSFVSNDPLVSTGYLQ